MLDNVESALYTAALAGEAWAVCFFLKTQGKARGYVERSRDEELLDMLREIGLLRAKIRELERGKPTRPGAGGTGEPAKGSRASIGRGVRRGTDGPPDDVSGRPAATDA
jgi:hypothetical protein